MIRSIFIAFVLFITSCSTGMMEIEEPENLLPKSKMTQVMLELVKLEAHIQGTYPSASQYHKTMLNSSDTLFKRLNVKSVDFEASMDYYGSHQDIMKEIYDDVLDELNSELGELQSKKK